MRFNLYALFAIVAVMASLSVSAQKSDSRKPKWMSGDVPAVNGNVEFLMAQGSGTSLEAARHNAMVDLVSKVEHERKVKVKSNSESSYEMTDGNVSERESFKMEVENDEGEVSLTCKVADEYWERKDGLYHVSDLFVVSAGQDAASIRVRTTTSYGVGPVFCSLIPGVGQFCKGSAVKGGFILGGSAVCAAAIVLCENQRAHYAKRMLENPDYIDFYRNKKSSWQTGRNVAIGAAAALYLYNLIDAAVAPGRRRVVIDKKSYQYSFGPVITPDSFGAAFAFNF